MAHELQSKANELIRALGALSVAQESLAGSDHIFELAQQAIDLRDALLSAHPDINPAY